MTTTTVREESLAPRSFYYFGLALFLSAAAAMAIPRAASDWIADSLLPGVEARASVALTPAPESAQVALASMTAAPPVETRESDPSKPVASPVPSTQVSSAALVAGLRARSGESAPLSAISPMSSGGVVRQPYLTQLGPNHVVIGWRSVNSTDSVVKYGTVQGSLTSTASAAASVTDHFVTISGLAPSQKYFYQVGDSGSGFTSHAGGTSDHYFVTAPTPGNPGPFRVWAVGDGGNGTSTQLNVMNAMLSAAGAERPDLALCLGDMAYASGSDSEYTVNYFAPYAPVLQNTVMWPTLGNHDGSSTYYGSFVLPTAAEAGGVASGTEAYYSFDYGNTHFISLNSFGVSRAANGPMATWLQSDLAASNAQWLVAFWHHPPYSKGTHDSDTEIELREMRENILPILEAGGVDLVLTGHSHIYERSYLIDGTYVTPTPSLATLTSQGHIIDGGDGKPTGDGAYSKGAGLNAHGGTVYVVAGHGAQGTSKTGNHPVMYFSDLSNGSVLIDVSGNELILRNIRATGTESDTFTIVKAVSCSTSADCTSLNDSCNDGSCNGSGVCVPLPKTNGTPCDDAIACTNNSLGCQAGACSAVDTCVSPQACNLQTGVCEVPPPPPLPIVEGNTFRYFKGTVEPPATWKNNGFDASSWPQGPSGFGYGDNDDNTVLSDMINSYASVYVRREFTVTDPAYVAALSLSVDFDDGFVCYLNGTEVNRSSNMTGTPPAFNTLAGSSHEAFRGDSGSSPQPAQVSSPSPALLVAGTNVLACQGHNQALNSSDFSLIPLLSATLYPCVVDTDCDSPNGCNAGACVSHVCSATPTNEGGPCDDSSVCTVTDVCASGTCAGSPVNCGAQFCHPATGECVDCATNANCTGGQVCSPSYVCVTPVTVTFQQGLSGYNNGFDTYIDSALGSQATASLIVVDNDPVEQVLLRFDGIFGAGAGQIPAGSTISAATLTLWAGANTNDESPNPVNLHRLLHTWVDTGLWANYGVAPWNATGGIQSDGVDAVAAIEATTTIGTPATSADLNVTASLQAWSSAPSSNFGWAILPTGTNGLRLESNESTTSSNARRPKLTIVYIPPPACTIDADCNDSNVCNGSETCSGSVCQAGTALNCDDTLVCTTDSCVPASGCAHTNNTIACSDGNGCTTGDTCAGGVCVPGGATVCNDSNPCTNDSCNTPTGCVFTNNSASCTDGNLCTTGDVCAGGTCAGSPVNCGAQICHPATGACVDCVVNGDCGVGQTCDAGTHSCVAAPVTVTFRQGVNGYTGTQDTFVHQNLPTTAQGSGVSWKWDTEDGVGFAAFGLIRFDSIFGSGAGQIPTGATITAANLTLVGFNATVAPAGTISEVAVDWQQSSATWNNFGGDAGVQSDEYRASPSYAAPLLTGAGAATPVTAVIDVLASLQSWLSNPALNFGWVFRPGSPDGAEVYSAEQTTESQRPLLTVTYTASTSCVNDSGCNDGNACTTDTCNLGNGTCSHAAVSCAWGACNPTHGQCEVTLSFQNGAAGYSGTIDTYLDEANSTLSRASDPAVFMDNDPTDKQALLRFDGIFGSNGTSQIPPGSIIRSATLNVYVNDASNTGAAFHRMLACWDDSNTWSTFGAGVQADGIEAVATSDFSSLQDTTGVLSPAPDVTVSVAAWSAGAANLGWVGLPLGGSGWGLDSAQGTNKPLLTVKFTPPAACTVDANCNDDNGCTTDTCNGSTGFCSHSANVGGSCTDGIGCTTDTCSSCGRCASVDGCTSPGVCNTSTGQCDVPPAPPNQPTNPSPANGATGVALSPQLCVDVSDPNGGTLSVTFKGRVGGGGSGTPFTVIALPDTQYYSQDTPPGPGLATTGVAQMTWIRDNRVARNIVAVTELGDCVDDAEQAYEWANANASHLVLENPTTTGLTDGIPYGVAVGNHDQYKAGAVPPTGYARSGTDENITTTDYNATFPKSRFASRAYHGGNYPLPGFADSMDNHYELFSGSGMDFIVFHLEWDEGNCSWPADGTPPTGTLNTCQNVLSWVRNLLMTSHSNRRAIITTHFMGTPTSGGTGILPPSNQGQAIINMAKGLPNVFLALGGHADQADSRTDLANDGHTIYTLVSDFQTSTNGGNGWLRIMTFDPVADTIHVETWSPTVAGGRFINKLANGTPNNHADNAAPTENEVTLAYDMDAGLPFQTIGANSSVASGSQTCMSWPGRASNQLYEWKVDVSDGTSTTAGPMWSFTTLSCTVNGDCNDSDPCTTDTCTSGVCGHAAVPLCCTTAAQCDDSNPCTTDSCNAGNTCDHVNNTATCNDGSFCTTNDTCSGGSCVGGAAPNCDDSNPCTNDSCVPASGCAHANNTASCNDSNACTTPDVCSGGACGGTYAPSAGCCATNAHCNDGVPATTDACTGGNCSNDTSGTCTTNPECDDGDACTTDTCNGANVAALSFDGTNDYVSMGAAAGLNASPAFTLEAWINGVNGTGTSTGNEGLSSAIPLVSKGRADAETPANLNMNYFLGISGGKLVGDFEDAATGLNHAVCATTNLPTSGWHHVAATYDVAGGWRLYLDGSALTTTNTNPACSTCAGGNCTTIPGATPEPNSIERFALGSALTAAQPTEAPAGFYAGQMDEVRVWNVARTQAQIQAAMNQSLTSGSGLIGRWGLNEGAGSTTADSDPNGDSTAWNGTLTGGPTWVTGAGNLPSVGTGSAEYVMEYAIADAIAGNDAMTPLHQWTMPDAWCNNANSWEGLAFVPDVRYTPTFANIPSGYFLGLCQGNNTYTAFTLDLTSAGGPVATPVQVDPDGDSVFQETPPCGIDLASGCGIDYEWSTGRLWWSAGTAVAVTDAQMNCLAAYSVAGVTDAEGIGVGNGYMVLADDQSSSAGVVRYPQPAVPGSAPSGTPFDHGDDDSSAITFSPLNNVWLLIKDSAAPKHGYVLSADLSSALADFDFPNQGGASVDSEGVTLTGPNASNFFVSTEQFGACGHAAIVGCCNTAAQCDDGNPCTADSCSAHACQHAAIAGCCLTNAECADANGCTDDSCNLGSHTCEHPNNSAACSDGNICTTGDTCVGGSCQPGSVNPNCCATDADCNDSSTCTTDSCNTPNVAAVTFPSPGAIANRVNFALGSGSDASPDYINYFGTSSFTIEGWVYTDGGAAASTGIFRHGRQGTATQVVVQLTGTGNLQLAGSVESNAGSQVDVLSPIVLTANTWNHFALVVDRAAQQVRIHVNGGAPTSGASAWGSSFISSTDPTMLGVGRDNSAVLNAPFDGRLDEIRIWNRALAAPEISANMNREIASAPGLVHRWSFNSFSSGTSVADSVGGITATLVGATSLSASPSLPFPGTNSCVFTTVSNGTACTDGDACTTGDVCTTGVCGGSPLNCDDGNTCTTDGCSAGVCTHTPVANGTTCSDGSICTQSDSCQAGTCVGSNPIVCTASDQCHDVGTCNPATGCSNPPKANGSSCNDGLACTTSDVCTAGTCAGTTVTCTALDQCHVAGTCNTGTGLCSNPEKANGTSCNDASACTAFDACTSGTCGGTPIVCNDGNACTNDSCNPATGCVFTNNSASCNDGNQCTTGETCSGGSCGGGIALSCPAGLSCNSTNGQCAPTPVTVTFQQGVSGYTGAVDTYINAAAATADQGANQLLTVDLAPSIQQALLRFDNIFGSGSGQIPTGATINSATLFLYVPTNSTATPVGFYRLKNTWTSSATWNTFGASPWNATTGIQVNDSQEVFTTADVLSAIPTIAGVGNTIAVTPSLQAWAANPAANFGWVLDVAVDDAVIFASAEGTAAQQPKLTVTYTPAFTCVTSADCVDGNVCTTAACVGSACQYDAIPNCCVTDADCYDGNACTADACNANQCTFTAIPNCCNAAGDCDDSNQCTTDACNLASQNQAAVLFPSPQSTANRINFAIGTGSNAAPDYINWFGTSSFTVEGWMYTDGVSSAANTSVFRAGRSGDFPLVGLQLTGLSLTASVEASQGGGVDDQYNAPAQTLIANTWTHFAVVVVRDLVTPTNQQLRLYVNGGTPTIATTGTANWGSSPIGSADQSMVAMSRDSAGAVTLPFVGRVDELRIWDSARTQAEIQANMNLEIVSAPGLKHRWSFNAGSGTTAVDSAGGITGTLGGLTAWTTSPLPVVGGKYCSHGNVASGTTCGSSSDTACDNPDTCNGAGTCVANNETNGTSCDDGSACTTGDVCTGGICSGAAITCNAPPPCHTAVGATCDTGTGACTYPAVSNGTSCDDGNACTTGDSCQSGTCTGTAVVCTASDQCHDAGTCTAGVCSNPPKANGATCDDNDACTTGTTCNNGSCSGTPTPVDCTDGDLCTTDSCAPLSGCHHDPVSCQPGHACSPATGLCEPTCTPTGPELCDGVDNDCNSGTADGSADPAVGVTCGTDTGECSTGTTQCVSGSVQCVGSVGPVAETCDGLDNDCDGATDESFPTLGQVCDGTDGDLCMEGTVVCTANHLSVECSDPNDEDLDLCNGSDDDCNPATADGSSDSAVGVTCGTDTGECTSGTTQCVSGSVQCVGSVGPVAETCDGLDNDCDGATDESFPTLGQVCDGTDGDLCMEGTVVCTANHLSVECSDPNDEDLDLCNGSDDDCNPATADGSSDSAVGVTCGTDTGECTSGTTQCLSGSVQCVGSVGPVAETCDGLDNDCDGATDEDFPTLGQACDGTDTDLCMEGTVVCTANHLSVECSDPNDEDLDLCNGSDDDCNPSTADGSSDSAVGVTCGTDTGECTSGTTQCLSGSVQCVGSVGPVAETCDSLDNDCDGSTDEDFPTLGQACDGTDTDLCMEGTVVCTANHLSVECSDPNDEDLDLCNGSDDDCNPATADGSSDGAVGVSCGTDTGECTSGTTQCLSGSVQCVGSVGPVAETCDGLDNDCDGSTDENFPTLGQACDGTDGDLCMEGVVVCTANHLSVECSDPNDEDLDLCNGSDDDCNPATADGSSDSAVGVTCGTDTGECTSGTTQCLSGSVQCVGSVGPVTETCDSLDNDCDGATDESFPTLGQACDGTDGDLCMEGTVVCTANHLSVECSDPNDEDLDLCNGSDDDCNPATADGSSDGAVGVSCGTDTGECTAGMTQCVSGSVQCVGSVGPVAETCDGLDNDCDGATDESFPTLGQSCDGTDGDLCMEGTVVCTANHLSVECSDPNDEDLDLCNGSDDDCNPATADGSSDSAVGVTCGTDTGECTSGTTQCVSGSVQCVGSVGPVAETCDGLDNDCDGATDESFPTLGQVCDGTDGDLCMEGTVVCTANHLSVECSDPNDEDLDLCNGSDDDCNPATADGSSDGAVGVSCGTDTGECSTGMTQCLSGSVQCVGSVGPVAETCDGLDNDCDGATDENPLSLCNDNNACTTGDSCQSGSCVPGTPVTCTDDGNVCNGPESCNSSNGQCETGPAATSGTACSDGNACTQTDACNGSGLCVGASPVVCNDNNTCTDDTCNPLNGFCVFLANNGNACTDGDACTTDTCSSGACVHAASGTCGVGGTVYYYRNSASGGSEPSVKTVPSVGIDGTQDSIADATTGGTGSYALGNLFGSVSVTTVNKYGSPRAADHNGAISSLDASTIARASVGLVTLTPNQVIAGDVTGIGGLSALDASEVARFAVGAVNHFTVSASGSDWKFLRCDSYPGCGAPVYNFTPISQAETGKNFYAVLYGDVTGNWQPSTGFTTMAATASETSAEEQEAIAADRLVADRLAGTVPIEAVPSVTGAPAELSLTMPAKTLRAGERRQLTIDLRNANGILGMDLGLRYDPASIRILDVATAGIGSGFTLAHADLQSGTHKISMFGVVPLSGSGSLLTVTVEVLKNTGNKPPLQLSGTANEGGIPIRIGKQKLQVPVMSR